MTLVLAAQLLCASAYAGFQWTVSLVVYPQLAEVPPSSFVAYERLHRRRVSHVVGPLFGALVGTTVLLCAIHPAGTPLWGLLASVGLLLVVLGTTGLLAVPLHRRLHHGWDPAVHRSLVRTDAIRVVAATANVVVATVLATR